MLFSLLSQKRLKKSLSVWITCKFCHHTWFSNLNPARKKSGKILLYIDFRNLNPSWNKNNYPVPSSEPMLHTIPETEMFSSLDRFLECYQVPIVEPDEPTLVHEKLGPHTYHFQSLGRRIDNLPANGQDLKHYFQ